MFVTSASVCGGWLLIERLEVFDASLVRHQFSSRSLDTMIVLELDSVVFVRSLL